ncbi:SusC/RagA family TonB-linked outer membrane protein [Capnocytophaga catalasegens]|uniref:SusC/RagA family TonB-linked outer membrane protein n=1 Tax=Capnocytophaga catalasegens TaxID=1004260 RepID=A0AAV5AXK9_9FLAO|nr:TonB-dependent receptor [Capnocytophaga catalasegens]GIZ16219.1 SusC/RagA family TonB-linked outer membrane protein [Capnocytophaga catalasegens]GJM49447.1 SusC/RagA family TonB-linked outer membrane protein [Capnocytophaga catalasegens]GJM53647.1 SusC/RagA family TonB-linked outer membrane protein [Capnocytophaga catalasegens]
MNNIKWFGLLFFCFFSLKITAQQQVVKGTVTDTSKEPLPGVNILIKGTTHGTVTDFDGNYELNAPKGAVLEFSFVGFQTQAKNVGVGNPVIINVTLQEDAQQLEDVVVIGYGVARKKDVTGSVNLVTTKDFNKAPAVNADQLLQGKVAGVSMTSNGGAPGEGQIIRVRGNGSLSLSSNPLIVIDGIPMNDGGVGGSRSIFNLVNPDDIESMTVLKDASSTAIFGSRAANGVIMITTKKGKAGQDMKISFNSSIAIQNAHEYVDVMSASQFRNLIMSTGNTNYISLLGNADTNWQEQIYQTAPMSNSSLSISGGGILPYRASLGHSYADGILRTDNFQRSTAKVTLTPSFFDKSLRFELNANGTYMRNRFAEKGAIGSAVIYDPTKPVYDTNSPFAGYSAWLDTSTGRLKGLAPINPLAQLYLTNDTSKVYNFIGNLKVDYTLPFFKEITATINAGLDYSKGKQEKYKDPRFPNASANYAGEREFYNKTITNKLFDAYVNYNKDIKDHTIGMMVGHSYQSFEFNDDIKKYQDFVNTADNKEYPNIDKSKNVLMSFFGRANYSYKDKYLLTATLRADASSKLAKEHRWGYFPSMALAWNIKNENFLKENEKINDLKLRLGYGEVGNVNGLGDYIYLTNYTRNINGAYYLFGNKPHITYRPEAVNRDLRWEIGNTLNIGLDFGFWDNRLTGTIDVYRKLTKDLIASSTVDAFTNFRNEVRANIGNMENKGIEFGLGYTPIRNDNFRWTINYNIAYNENKITKLPKVESTGSISGGTGNQVQRHQEGEIPFAFFVYQQIYDTNGKPIENAFVDRNGDGKITEDDRYFYKSPFAPVTMGLGMDLNYKNWDLNITTRANIGNYVYNNTQSQRDYFADAVDKNILRNLMSNYAETSFQQRSGEAWLSDLYVENASFFKLDNITLGYTFPSDKYNIRVYGTMQNVLTLTKYRGLDPEVIVPDIIGIKNGIDNNFYPRPQTYLVGLNVNF